jgi:molybdopterin synthase sulfur carrier subunit
MAKVFIASPIRSCTRGASTVNVEANSVQDAMDHLVQIYPKLRPQLYDDMGALHHFVNLFVNGNAIQDKEGFAGRLSDNDTVEILLAVCGGSQDAVKMGLSR